MFFSENLYDDTSLVSASAACIYDPSAAGLDQDWTGVIVDLNAADGTFRIAGSAAENSNTWDLFPGDTLTCSYDVRIDNSVRAGDQAVSNIVTATYDSANGNQTEEDTFTTGPEDTLLHVPSPSLTKDEDSDADAYQSEGYQRGELVPFVIRVTLPEAVTTDLNVTDVLPDGLEFAGTTEAVLHGNTLNPTSPGLGSSGNIVWHFGAVSVPGDATTDHLSDENVLTLRYNARVRDNAATGPISNSAAANFDAPEEPNQPVEDDTATVTIIQPTMDIAKSASPLVVDAGDAVTYTVTVTNTSDNGGALYDLVLTVDLAGPLSLVANSPHAASTAGQVQTSR